jgi:hypothetical protein
VQSITIRFYIKANNTFDWTSKKGRAFKSSLSFHSTIVYRLTDFRKFSRRNKFGTRRVDILAQSPPLSMVFFVRLYRIWWRQLEPAYY